MHIRQIALVAHALEPVVADLCAVFGLEIAFRDPDVAVFGLHNAVIPVGQTFLEVVSPVREDTTAGRLLEKRRGDGGYMVILQTAQLDVDRHRLAALGVRIAWQIAFDDIATVHLHPRDVGGAIVSLDEARPPASWRWAGPEWTTKVQTDVVRAITSVTVAALDPEAMATRWAEVLGLATSGIGGTEIALDGSVIRFTTADARGEGVSAVGLEAVDAERALATASVRGLPIERQSIAIGGVRFELNGPIG